MVEQIKQPNGGQTDSGRIPWVTRWGKYDWSTEYAKMLQPKVPGRILRDKYPSVG